MVSVGVVCGVAWVQGAASVRRWWSTWVGCVV